MPQSKQLSRANSTQKPHQTSVVGEVAPSDSAEWKLSRRGFLVMTAMAGTGLAVAGCGIVRQQMADYIENLAPSFESGAKPTVWFEVAADGCVTLFCPKVEMGQGVHTALGQIAAEELGVEWHKLKVVTASTLHGPIDPRSTGGSDTITSMYDMLRNVAAEMRGMLIANAAPLLGLAESALIAENSEVRTKDGSKKIGFGEIVKKASAWKTASQKPALKSKADFTFIGKSLPRVDVEAKVRGEAVFGIDSVMPGMLYGAIVFPPVVGATFKSARAGKAASMPGVVKVVIESDFAGVVAETRTAAELAKEAIEVEWNIPKRWTQAEIDAMLKVGSGKATVIQEAGNPTKFLSDPATANAVIRAEYSSPMAAHAALEPNGGVAWFQGDKITIMMSTQVPKITQDEVASAFGLKTENVDIQTTFLGGGFGGRLHTPHAVKIAKLSKAVGKPVHAFFERKEEFQNGYLRPPTHHTLQAILNADGTINAIEHNTSSGDVAFPSPIVPSYAPMIFGADFGAWRGGRLTYDVQNKRTVAWRVKLPVYTSWWRGLGLLANTFAIESFMDELAAKAGLDAQEFRLKHLGSSETSMRMKSVLKAVTEKAGWKTFNRPGRALGLACSTDVGTPVAQVAEVSLEGGRVRVHKITCAIDVGVAVNPDGVKAQCEGGIIMALSSALMEGIYLQDNGELGPAMYGAYPILTMRDAPEIDIIILQSGDKPRGVGEPPMGPVAAAVANALFKLTGKRLRTLPLQEYLS